MIYINLSKLLSLVFNLMLRYFCKLFLSKHSSIIYIKIISLTPLMLLWDLIRHRLSLMRLSTDWLMFKSLKIINYWWSRNWGVSMKRPFKNTIKFSNSKKVSHILTYAKFLNTFEMTWKTLLCWCSSHKIVINCNFTIKRTEYYKSIIFRNLKIWAIKLSDLITIFNMFELLAITS